MLIVSKTARISKLADVEDSVRGELPAYSINVGTPAKTTGCGR